MNQCVVYDAPVSSIGITPVSAAGNDDYRVSIRVPGEQWRELFVYEVKVDMHEVRRASMVYFDMEGSVEVRVEPRNLPIREAVIRPLSLKLPVQQSDDAITFTLDKPCKIVVEINGQRFTALHLFANPLESDPVDPEDEETLVLPPGAHGSEYIGRALTTPLEPGGKPPRVVYFAPGMHYIVETVLRIPSGTTVYIAGGAVVVGSLVCEHAEDVTIRGRGIIYLADFNRFTALRGLRIVFSKRIAVEGIIVVDPPHYSIYLGSSEHVQIRNFKAFSTRGWSDGIDMMACSHIEIDDIFMRNSDDCIAIYGSRWEFQGDSRHITVRNAVLWADVAHAMNIGGHGNHHKGGDTLEHIHFENIDILEHHEPQEFYWGAMNINAGDLNTVRNVVYEDIRVEDFEMGQLVDIRVVFNEKYNPAPGRRIENIVFRNIRYDGANKNPNRIYGHDAEKVVENIRFENLRINGELILHPEQGNFDINGFAKGVSFHEKIMD
ncbi:glycosyl hydrolase family 28 protein [Paenibacillus sp.]|uniref:glycosyl hydrolase family 28 protein n=1 Tax=Paenibacillus sp. TaxID=58172 RepID=UPI0028115A61|nr:glycosyl hydrolase family 28 protein [Paenibacillus sp.]